MTKEEIVLNAIIETVPQWYISNIGPQRYFLTLNEFQVGYCSHRARTPALLELIGFANVNLVHWLNQLPQIPTPISIGKIKEDLALKWLNIYDLSINWNKLIAYAEGLSIRTYENQPVIINLLIREGNGSHDITNPTIQKLFDPLASTQNVYLVVDKELNFLNYKQVLWSETQDSRGYKFNPEFLQQFKSCLGEGECSFHLTQRGDMVILGRGGLLASRRKGQWYVYDVNTFKNSIVDILGNYRIGCNLFEILFDLSYRRHGALLIFDPDHQVINQVVNQNSIIAGPNSDPDFVRSMLAPIVGTINMDHPQYGHRKKHLFLEIASIDGAVIFDENNILAFGAMIQSHPQVGSHVGARTTAAKSAYLWGGKPIKISADGDVTVYFQSQSEDGQSTNSELRFM